jgi:hypothetical protein
VVVQFVEEGLKGFLDAGEVHHPACRLVDRAGDVDLDAE